MKDPIGQAVKDYCINGKANDILIESNYTSDEFIPSSYFFRNEIELPIIEKVALENFYGNILDIGAGAGCHSIILQEKGLDVTALKISPLACEVLISRGVRKVLNSDIYKTTNKQFDTILLLMNGTGIAGNIKGLSHLLNHLKKLLSPGGQILIDSSDIKYLFSEEDGSTWIDIANNNYYGEMTYIASYKDIISDPFKWLFIDFKKLKTIAQKCGYRCVKVVDGDHFDYLAMLTIN
ncbi:MAG: methyltransferase domain-containing protein [Mariniphaga sp.]|nr:methyltransferase domain-containing protein [Mariniphaga sp.]